MKPVVAILGSLNMDFVVSVPEMPAPGQTVLGSNFQMLPGGKGANQAYACGRLGAGIVSTRMAGRVGYDSFGDHLKASLSGVGVDVSAVRATRLEPSGVALIWVDRMAQNAIVVASGANHVITADDAAALRPTFAGASYALFQLETPMDAVQSGLQVAKECGAKTMLDPAPARALDKGMLRHVHILTPNETEACVLLGRPVARISADDAAEAASELRARFEVQIVVLKLGEHGCFWLDCERGLHVPAFEVKAVDTTAAGDTFNAGLAVGLAEGKSVEDALRFANAAAAMSVTKPGAQASVPARGDVERFLQR